MADQKRKTVVDVAPLLWSRHQKSRLMDLLPTCLLWRQFREAICRGIRRSKPWCSRFVDKGSFQGFMFVITMFLLFGGDVKAIATSASADLVFNIVYIVSFFLFVFELIVSCIGKDDYFLSFFFFLDLIATASLILDITWVYDLFIHGDTAVARAGRMSRVGTRAGRVIRLIRLIRIVKLYKHVMDLRTRAQKGEEGGAKPGEATEDEVYVESRVGQKLANMTTQKVIILCLFIFILLPLISEEEFYTELPTTAQFGADIVYRSYSKCMNSGNINFHVFNSSILCQNFEQQLTLYIGYHHQQHANGCQHRWNQAFDNKCKLDLGWIGFHKDSPFRGVGYEHKAVEEYWDDLWSHVTNFHPGVLSDGAKSKLNQGSVKFCADSDSDFLYTSLINEDDLVCPEDLRTAETFLVGPMLVPLGHSAQMVFVFDLRPAERRRAVFNIMGTCFICLMLALGAMVFSHNANVLVLQPIERMISKVQKIRDNPLYAMKLGDESYREQQEEMENPTRTGQRRQRLWWGSREASSQKARTLETNILENAIIKLGKLLALGFGEAGSEIIGKNMHDDSATVNAMIPGNKVEAVFGICNIWNFTDTTEVLQDKVMVFVNQVAEIVHNIVDTWHGAANRNIGDAFLIVWRMREDFTQEMRTKFGDMSVLSFVMVVAAINKSAVLKDYREHPALLARLPNYRVRMGFGLHCGWAIEGAIGSEFKIDASYLSPHVNMACRLEAVTKQYHLQILMSEPLAGLCSSEIALTYFRTIDHVTLRGGMSTPIRLFTVDLNAEGLKTEQSVPRKSRNPFAVRMQREKAKEERMSPSFKVYQVFDRDDDIQTMRKGFPKHFFTVFNKGYLNYEAGEWEVARVVFEVTKDMLGRQDGPSKALLDYMASFGYDPSKATPKGWPGYRELTET